MFSRADGFFRALRAFGDPSKSETRTYLAVGLSVVGRHEDALAQGREAARLLLSGQTLHRLFHYAVFAERLGEAKEIYEQILERKEDYPSTHFLHTLLAFLQGDQPAMQQEWSWAAQHPGTDNDVSYLQEKFAAYHGRSREAHRLRDQLIDIARRNHNLYVASFSASGALMEAELGESVQSRTSVAEALEMSQSENTLLFAALASARNGDIAQAQKLTDDEYYQFPQDFLVQRFSLPTIRAAIKLSQNDPAAAVRILQPVTPYDLAIANHGFDNVIPAYLRGLAWLQLKNGRLAAPEFQKVLDHEAVVEGLVTGALARLQLARAQAMMGDPVAARKSYEDFLALWNDADSDIAIYKEAKAEYVRIAK